MGVTTPDGTQSKEVLDPGPNTPPEAKESSGPESRPSAGLRPAGKEPSRKTKISGAERLMCRNQTCRHFLLEVKSSGYEVLVICARCKMENHFAHPELK